MFNSGTRKDDANPYVLSVIAEGAIFKGELDVRGIVHINGDFFGNIKIDGDIAVGATGRAKCTVNAQNVIVNGIFYGEIKASESVKLHAPAIVFGSIEAASVYVEDGVICNGDIKIIRDSTAFSNDNKRVRRRKSRDDTEKKGYSVW